MTKIWSDREIKYLLREARERSIRTLRAGLPLRTTGAIQAKIYRLKISTKPRGDNVPLTIAAQRCGVTLVKLREILHAEKVDTVVGIPTPKVKMPTGSPGRPTGKPEPLTRICQRHGFVYKTARKLCAAGGVACTKIRRRYFALDSDIFEAMKDKRQRKSGPRQHVDINEAIAATRNFLRRTQADEWQSISMIARRTGETQRVIARLAKNKKLQTRREGRWRFYLESEVIAALSEKRQREG